jgi:Cu(I)/Ag(I) efflux system membrane protein CusA/SilA
MKRIAAPMIGGLVTSFVLELLVYPAIFAIWKGRELGAVSHGARYHPACPAKQP